MAIPSWVTGEVVLSSLPDQGQSQGVWEASPLSGSTFSLVQVTERSATGNI